MARKSTRPGQSLDETVPGRHDRSRLKRDGHTVHAVQPSSKNIGARGMNGETPYFRFYADSWRARLAGLPASAQALVLQAAAIGWAEKRGDAVKLNLGAWARACGCSIESVRGALEELVTLEWLDLKCDGDSLSIGIPDLAGQAKLVTYERDKKRAQRSKEKGQSPGRIDRGSELRESEGRAASSRSGSSRPAPVASDEERHAALRPVIDKIGRMPKVEWKAACP